MALSAPSLVRATSTALLSIAAWISATGAVACSSERIAVRRSSAKSLTMVCISSLMSAICFGSCARAVKPTPSSENIELVLVVSPEELHHAYGSWCTRGLVLCSEEKRHLHGEAGLQ